MLISTNRKQEKVKHFLLIFLSFLHLFSFSNVWYKSNDKRHNKICVTCELFILAIWIFERFPKKESSSSFIAINIQPFFFTFSFHSCARNYIIGMHGRRYSSLSCVFRRRSRDVNSFPRIFRLEETSPRCNFRCIIVKV